MSVPDVTPRNPFGQALHVTADAVVIRADGTTDNDQNTPED